MNKEQLQDNHAGTNRVASARLLVRLLSGRLPIVAIRGSVC